MSHRPDTFAQHLSRWERMLTARTKWTQEAWLDVRFEAGKTWTQDELWIFQQQGRAPSNYNLIRPSVELLCGIEQSTRSNPVVRPRTRATVDSAEGLTDLLGYVGDQNNTAQHISHAFRQAACVGVGWLEACANEDPMAEQVANRSVNAFDVWLDPTSKCDDLSDAMDLCRAKYVHPAWLALKFPRSKGEWGVGQATQMDPYSHTADYANEHNDRPPVSRMNGGIGASPRFGPGHGIAPTLFDGAGYGQDLDFLYRMDRYEGLVLTVERWYRCDEWSNFARFRDGRVVEVVPERVNEIAAALLAGECHVLKALSKKMRCAIFTEKGILADFESPYRFQDFPLVPLWAYRDDEYMPRGLVASLRDPQKEFNARRTKLLRDSMQRQIIAEQDTFIDEDEARRELAKPDGFVRVRQGALISRKMEIRDNQETSSVQASLLEGARAMVQDMSGVTAELLGQETNATSGKAIQARQAQGQTAMFSLFENRNKAQKALAERTVSLIQQYYTDEMELRITGKDRPGLDFITLNARTGENDITQARFDVVMDTQPSTPTQRMMRLEALSTFLGGLPPEVKLLFATDMAEAADMPESFIKKLGDVIGQVIGGAMQPQPMPPSEAPMPPAEGPPEPPAQAPMVA